MIRRLLVIAALVAGCAEGTAEDGGAAAREDAGPETESAAIDPGFETGSVSVDSLLDEREAHLANLRRLTFGGQNAEAYFSPDDERLIFQATPRDGSDLERITYTGDFDGFPMFDSDGSQLVFASNRGNELPRETNLFIADWVD